MLSELLLALEHLLAFDGLPPVGRDTLEVVHRMDPGGLDEHALGSLEGRWVGITGCDENPYRRHREFSLVEGLTRLGHPLQARAIRTCSLAVPHATLNVEASHDAADRWPSRS